jgi:outer membrane protein TolC
MELNKLAKNNYEVLKQHLQATESRFEVGEVTITDLSQAKARFLKASANEIKTRGEIEIERSNYFALVGKNPSNVLRFPKEDYFIPQSLKEVIEISLKHNPRIISFGLVKKASFLDISLAATELLPKVDLNLSAQKAWDPNTFFNEYENYKVDLSVKVPLYNGGINYANVRQKRHLAVEQAMLLDNEIKKLVKEIETIWFSLKTYKNQVKAIKASIKASNTALKGVKEEASVGTRTTLDVLDAEQEALQESIELIIVKNNILSTKYELLEKMGRLSPSTLNLSTLKNNYEKDYEAVKNIWLGFDG